MKNIKILKPTCKLRKRAFNLNNDNWQTFRTKCIELLVILKAFQFNQSRGLDWFEPKEELLNNYMPNWRVYLLKLVNIGIIEVNPYNQKIDFSDNRYSLSTLELRNSNKVNKLKDVLLCIDKNHYTEIYKKRRKWKKKKKRSYIGGLFYV